MSAAFSSSLLGGKTLVLNRSYLPIHVTSVRRAFSLLYRGVARAVDEEYRTFDFRDWSELSTVDRVSQDVPSWVGSRGPSEPRNATDSATAYRVDRLDSRRGDQIVRIGHLKARLGRRRPELTSLLELTSATSLETLVHYACPTKLKGGRHGRGSSETPSRTWAD